MSIQLEIDAAEQAQRRLVVDDENRSALGSPSVVHRRASVPGSGGRGGRRRPPAVDSPAVRSKLGSGASTGYGDALERVRRDLAPTLRALDAAAADPDALARAGDALPALQYALHTAGERVLGLEPLPGREEAHEELAAALAIAREETADVAETFEEAGPRAAAPLLWEWRASLFGVKLALHGVRQNGPDAPERGSLARALASVAVLALGVGAVLGGALVDIWPLWAAGLALVALSTGLSRRRP